MGCTVTGLASVLETLSEAIAKIQLLSEFNDILPTHDGTNYFSLWAGMYFVQMTLTVWFGNECSDAFSECAIHD